jgi:hypothetical protein
MDIREHEGSIVLAYGEPFKSPNAPEQIWALDLVTGDEVIVPA